MKLLKINAHNNNIYVNVWDEVKNPKGVVLIVHSFKQSGKNYSQLAEFLNKQNYLVWATDIRMHGKHREDNKNKENFGKVPRHTDLFKEIVSDHFITLKYLSDKYNLPITLLGHGYGSYIVKRLIQICDYAKNAIISGSAYNFNSLLVKMKTASNCMSLFSKNEKVHKQFEDLFYGSIQKRLFIGNWYSIDEYLYEDYIEESKDITLPICFYKSWLNNVVTKEKNLANISPNTRILIISGKNDVFSNGDKDQNKIADMYKKIGLDTQVHLFDGLRHNLYEEEDNQNVFEVILQFINNSNN